MSLRGKQLVSAKEGECWIDEDGEYKPLPNLVNIKMEIDLGNQAQEVLGKSLKVHRNFGGEITGTAEIYDNSAAFTDQLFSFVTNGTSTYFNIKCVAEDATSSTGKRIYTFIDCLVTKATMFEIDTAGTSLKKSLSLTADDVIRGDEFNVLEG